MTEKRRRGVLMRMRKGLGSPFGYILTGFGWVIERLIPGRIGRIIGAVIILLIWAGLMVVLNYPKLVRFWSDSVPPAQ